MNFFIKVCNYFFDWAWRQRGTSNTRKFTGVLWYNAVTWLSAAIAFVIIFEKLDWTLMTYLYPNLSMWSSYFFSESLHLKSYAWTVNSFKLSYIIIAKLFAHFIPFWFVLKLYSAIAYVPLGNDVLNIRWFLYNFLSVFWTSKS